MGIDQTIDRTNRLAQESYFRPNLLARGSETASQPPASTDDLSDAITEVIEAFRIVETPNRLDISAKMNRYARKQLLLYAHKMAEIAVRRSSQDDLEKGLTALALEGGSEDWRFSIVGLAMLFHSASKLGLDTKRLFRENARLCADEIVSKEMAEFPARTPESRDLRAFDLRESEGPEGFTYHQTGFL